MELAQLCQDLGFRNYLLECEIPSEIEKLQNRIYDVQKECKKLADELEEAQKAMRESKNGQMVHMTPPLEESPSPAPVLEKVELQ
jgi:vacuolar-type H+-ATPase subunit I/STV1